MHCSRECHNTANSRNGNPARVEKLHQAIKRGEWKNPREGLSEEIKRELNATASRKGRLREVAEGRWRNPALSAEAREKLSRPRTVTDPPVHRAIELMRQGTKLRDLPDDLHQAYNAHSREYERQHRDEIRAKQRAAYHRKQAAMTDEEREKQRAKWRAENKKKSARKSS